MNYTNLQALAAVVNSLFYFSWKMLIMKLLQTFFIILCLFSNNSLMKKKKPNDTGPCNLQKCLLGMIKNIIDNITT
jgi:hypothetical protein